MKVWVDEEPLLQAELRSRREEHLLSVPPGEHVIRVQVEGGGDVWMNRVRGRLTLGSTRRLQAKLTGLPGDRTSSLFLMPLF